MEEKIVEQINGTIKNMYIPKIIKDGEEVGDAFIEKICFEIQTEKGMYKIFEDRYSKCASLFVGDKVIINKIVKKCDYDEFLEFIDEYVDMYYSNLSVEKRNELYNKYTCSKEEFDANPKGIIEYRIVM